MMLLVELLLMLLNLYGLVVLVNVILGWLLVFNVINGQNQLVRNVYDFTRALTDPVLKHIRRYMNPVNGVDLSPLVLLILVWLAKRILLYYIAPFIVF